jgi:zinc protease
MIKSLRFRASWVFAFLCSSFISAQSQPKLLETVQPNSAGTNIPYQKWQLGNGLVVIVHTDRSDPVVHVDVTYHVGSARELAGRSGFAHFFEHMMFQGSENVGDEQHFKIVTAAGGTLNGTTNLDRTNYFETLPANQLEVALWLEADRMGFLLDAVTQEKFEIQRATVKNERGQNYDNRPYGLVYEKTIEALYPPGHPYSWTTIGYIEDLNAAELKDLKDFFLRWYGPNNAVLTIAGDVDATKAIQLANKYFGTIPRGPEVKNMNPIPAGLKETRFISYEDNIRAPLLSITYPTVEARHEDELPLDILANLLGGGKASVFYSRFIKNGKARRADAYHPTAELAGYMQFSILGFPDKPLQDLLLEVQAAFEHFEKRGVTETDIRRYRASEERRTLLGLQTVRGKASKLAYNQTFTGNPNYIESELKRLNEVKPEDVIRVYKKYIKGKAAVILSVIPKGRSDLSAAPDNWVFSKTRMENDLSEYQKLSPRKAKDHFDRSKQPQPAAVPVLKTPTVWNNIHPSGARYNGTAFQELPYSMIRVCFPAGHLNTAPEKAGLAKLTAAMLNESTRVRSAADMEDTLALLGSSITISTDEQDLEVEMVFRNNQWESTLKLLLERLAKPAFIPEEFERAKKMQLEDIQNNMNNAGTLANLILMQQLFGETIMGLPQSGTAKTVESITLEEVMSFYIHFVRIKYARITYLGNLNQNAFLSQFEPLLNWQNEWNTTLRGEDDPIPRPQIKQLPPPEENTLYFFDKPGAAQSEIRIFLPGIPFELLGEFYTLNLANYPFGGAFNSRLNINLRENKGYTYGVRSAFNGNAYTGYFLISGGFLKHATDSTLIEIMMELKKILRYGISDEEIEFTQSSISQRDALNYESMAQKSRFLDDLLVHNASPDYVRKRTDLLKKWNKQDANALLKKWITLRGLQIVVVGDKASVFESVSRLGFKMITIDSLGN